MAIKYATRFRATARVARFAFPFCLAWSYSCASAGLSRGAILAASQRVWTAISMRMICLVFAMFWRQASTTLSKFDLPTYRKSLKLIVPLRASTSEGIKAVLNVT